MEKLEIQQQLVEYRRMKRLARFARSWVVSGFLLLLAFGALLYAGEHLLHLLVAF